MKCALLFLTAALLLMACDSPPSGSHVTVVVLDSRQRLVGGVPIVVNDAAGAVSHVTVSGRDGTVTVLVPAHGSIAASYSAALSFETVAVLDPPDGATVPIALALADPAPTLPESRTFYLLNTPEVPALASWVS